MAQLPPESNDNLGNIGVFLSMLAAVATGAYTWWNNNGPGKPKEKVDEPPKVDPDMQTIEGLKGIVLLLQQENARLIAENERLWGRLQTVEQYIYTLQMKMADLNTRMNHGDRRMDNMDASSGTTSR